MRAWQWKNIGRLRPKATTTLMQKGYISVRLTSTGHPYLLHNPIKDGRAELHPESRAVMVVLQVFFKTPAADRLFLFDYIGKYRDIF